MTANLRKHYTQMTDTERSAVRSFAHSIHTWRGLNNPHITERKAKWSLTDNAILQALSNGEIIEVHGNNAPELRFVLRHIQGNRAVCVCASATTKSIVTAWVNNAHDNHMTLDRSQYQLTADLTRVFHTL
jgi:hypothetical protein